VAPTIAGIIITKLPVSYPKKQLAKASLKTEK
jgi:hypothetical protein